MLPVTLNSANLSILLIGAGEKLKNREAKLRQAGVVKLEVRDQKSEINNFQDFDVVMITGLDEDASAKLHKQAKAAGCLVNVEDNKKYSDFFFTAVLKRGKLQISVATEGTSPGTARIIRDHLAKLFPEDWDARVDEIAKMRQKWKSEGLNYDQVDKLTEQYVRDNKWLD